MTKKLLSIILALILLLAAVPTTALSAYAEDVELAETGEKISSVSVIGVIKPYIGTNPVYSAAAPSEAVYKVENKNDSIWKNGVSWYNFTDSTFVFPDSDKTFEKGKEYGVFITLRITSNDCQFSDELSATVNGVSAVISSKSESAVTLFYKFSILEPGDTYVIAGSYDFLGDYSWYPERDKNVMTGQSDGTYAITVPNVPATAPGQYLSVKVVKIDSNDNNTWYGINGTDANYDFMTRAKGDVTVTFDPVTKEISVTGPYVKEALTYVIAGSYDFLGDNSWAPERDKNVMTEQSDGTYAITVPNVPATVSGKYLSVKVVKIDSNDNNTWYGVDGTDANYDFITTAKGSVTVTFDPLTKKISVTGPYVEKAATFTVSGTITSYLDAEGQVKIQLVKPSTMELIVSMVVTGNTVNYSINNVPAGTYTISVLKENHVTKSGKLTVSGNTTKDVKICPKGDISGDGKVTTKDYAMANAHAQKVSLLTDEYALKCGDVLKGDGKITTADAARINAAAQKIDPLW